MNQTVDASKEAGSLQQSTVLGNPPSSNSMRLFEGTQVSKDVLGWLLKDKFLVSYSLRAISSFLLLVSSPLMLWNIVYSHCISFLEFLIKTTATEPDNSSIILV